MDDAIIVYRPSSMVSRTSNGCRHSGTGMSYTPQELMVAAAAREIRDGEIVFVGMRLPLIAFALARETHAPTAVGLFELGIVREAPAPELLYTMGDPPNVAGATWCA